MFFSFALLIAPLSSSLRSSQKVNIGGVDQKGEWCVQGNLILYSKRNTEVNWLLGRSKQEMRAEVLGKGEGNSCRIRLDEKSKKHQNSAAGVKNLEFSRDVTVVEKVCERLKGDANYRVTFTSHYSNGCHFTFGAFRFSVKPVFTDKDALDVAASREAFKQPLGDECSDPTLRECCLKCAKSECRSLGAKITFSSAQNGQCQVKYKGVNFVLTDEEIKTVAAIDKKAKEKLCLYDEGRQFTLTKAGSRRSAYLVSNQKLDGCELTLYSEENNQVVYHTVAYDALLYSGTRSSDISITETWNEAKARSSAKTFNVNWCQKGNEVSFFEKDEAKTALVSILVPPSKSVDWSKTYCKLIDGSSVSIFQPVSSLTTVCQRVKDLFDEELRARIKLEKDSSPCVFTASEERKYVINPSFNADVTLNVEKTTAAVKCSKKCAESIECRSLGAQLTFEASDGKKCAAAYKSVKLELTDEDMQSVGAIDRKAKQTLCFSTRPQHTGNPQMQRYMISNQKVDGCQLTLYQPNGEGALISRTVDYNDLGYQDALPFGVSFQKTWDKAESSGEPNLVKLDWCKKGNMILFDWEGKSDIREVQSDQSLVDSEGKFKDLQKTVCPVDGGKISILQPVTPVCDRVLELVREADVTTTLVSQDSSRCVFGFSANPLQYSLRPSLNKDGTFNEEATKLAASWARKCAQSDECRPLGQELMYQSCNAQKCKVVYKGKISDMTDDNMKSTGFFDTIKVEAKMKFCSSDPLRLTTEGNIEYMMGNQRLNDCIVTLYKKESDGTVLSSTIPYESLEYSQYTGVVSFPRTWDKAAARQVNLDWCKKDTKISFYREGTEITATVLADSNVEGKDFGTWSEIECKVSVKEPAKDSEKKPLSILQPVTVIPRSQ